MRLLLVLFALSIAHPSSAGSPGMQLDLAQAERLAALPLGCIQQPFPYKSHHVLAAPEELALPQVHHPAFYGCFDWHSAVHGHWSLVFLLKQFPEIASATTIRERLAQNLTAENIAAEVAYFSMNRESESFSRTYGWAWLLKLSEELRGWDDEQGQEWARNLQPLADLLCAKYVEYLPKLVYPIRVGEHTNTAFGLNFALDYARSAPHPELARVIESRARDFYLDDAGCPLDWEPSGYDFLSPCLQELDLMRKVLTPEEFGPWAERFLPGIASGELALVPGEVIDRSDGKLVHLDGLNFSRAWCLYPLADRHPVLLAVADAHVAHSLDRIVDGDYSGQHWLASFALYALKTRGESAAGR